MLQKFKYGLFFFNRISNFTKSLLRLCTNHFWIWKIKISDFSYQSSLHSEAAFRRFSSKRMFHVLKFRNIHRKTPMLESLCICNKVKGLKACSFIKMRLQHRCFPVNIVKFLRAAFFIEHFWWLLLFIAIFPVLCSIKHAYTTS